MQNLLLFVIRLMYVLRYTTIVSLRLSALVTLVVVFLSNVWLGQLVLLEQSIIIFLQSYLICVLVATVIVYIWAVRSSR